MIHDAIETMNEGFMQRIENSSVDLRNECPKHLSVSEHIGLLAALNSL
jgi:hypothetical protein